MNRSYSMDWSPGSLSPGTANDVLKRKSKAVARLKEELRAEANEKEEIEEKLREYKNEINVLDKKLTKKNLENEELKKDLRFVQEKLDETQSMIDSKNRSGEIALLKADVSSMAKMNHDLEETNETLVQNIKRLENKNHSLLDRVEEVTSKLSTLTEEHAEKLNVIDRLHEERNRIMIELSEVKDDNLALREERMNNAASKNQHNFSVENGDSLQRELEFQSMKDELDTMSCNMRIIEQEQASLVNNCEILKREKTDLQTSINDLEKKNYLLQEQCNSFAEKIDNLTTENKEYSSQLSTLNKELENSSHEKTSLEEIIEKLEHSMKCIDDELKSRTNSYEIAEKLAKELEVKLLANAESLEFYIQENGTLKKNIEGLTKDNCVYAVSLSDANKRNFELSNENNNLEKIVKTQNNEINENKNKIESLETKLDEKDSTYKNMIKEFQQLESKNNELNKVYENYVKLLDESECEKEKLRVANQELENQLNTCNKNYEILEREKAILTSSNENLKQLNTECDERVISLSADKENLIENLRQFEITHANLNTNYERLQNEKEIIDKNNCQLKESLDEVNYKFIVLSEESKNKESMLNDNYAILLDEKIGIEKNYCEIVKTLTELNEKYATLSLELTQKDQIFTFKINEYELLLLKYKKLHADHQLVIEQNKIFSKEIEEMKNNIFVLQDDKKSLENKSLEINNAFQQLQTDLYSCFQYGNDVIHKFNWESAQLTGGNISQSWKTLFDKISQGGCSLVDQIQQLTEDNTNSTNKLFAIEKEFNTHIEKYELLLVDKSKLESENKSITHELESITNKLNEYSLQYDSAIQEHDKKIKDFEHNLNLLKNELQKTEMKLHDTEKVKLELENIIQLQKKDYESLQVIHQSQCKELERFIEQFADIKEQLSINTVEFNSLQDSLNKVKSERDEYLEMLKVANEELDTLKSESIKCNDTLEECCVKLKHAEEQKLTAENILQDKINECNRLQELYGLKCDEFEKLRNSNAKLESERDVYIAKQKTDNEEFLSLQSQYEILKSILNETNMKLESICGEKINLENIYRSQTTELASCVQKLTAFDEKYSAKCVELKELQTLYNTIMSEREKLHLEIAESQSVTESKLKYVESIAHNLKLENIRLKEEKESCISRNRDLSERISEVEHELALLQSDHQTLVNDFTDKSVRLEKNILLCDKLEKEIADREEELRICNKERESLVSKIDKIEEELPKAMKEMEERHKECMLLKSEEQNKNLRIEDLENEIKKGEENRILLTDKLARLEDEHRMCSENQKELLNEKCAFKGKNVSLLRDIEEFKKKYEDLNDRYLQLEKDIWELHELRDMHVHQIDQLQSKNHYLQSENEKLTLYNDEKIQFLRVVEQRFRKFYEKTRKDNVEKGIVESATPSANLDFNLIIDLLESKEKEVTDLLQKKEEYCNQMQSLKHNAEENERECAYLKDTIREKTDELEEVRTNSQNLSADIVNINRQKEVLEIEVTELTSMVQKLNEKVEIKYHEIENVHRDLSQKNVELEQTRAKLTESESEIMSLLEKESKFQQEQDTLTNRLYEMEEQNQKNRERVEELCMQNEELFKVEKINSETFGSRIETITARNKKLSDEIEGKDMKLVALMAENHNMKETIEKLQNENSAIKLTESTNEKLVHENAQLNDTVKQKQEQIQTLNKRLVEECDKVEMIKRSHLNQLHKQIELNKHLEEKLQSDEQVVNNTINEQQVKDLQSKLDKLYEINSKLTQDLKINSSDIKSLVNENQILTRKVNELETSKKDLKMKKDNLSKERDDLVQIKDRLISENSQHVEKYNVFYNEYLKIVNNKDELGKEFVETVIKENKSLSSKNDELLQLHQQLSEQIIDKNGQIEKLSLKLEEFECEKKASLHGEAEQQLNVTHVIATGAENELRDCNSKLQDQLEKCTLKISVLEGELTKHKNSEQELAKNLFHKITKKTKEEYEGKLERAKAEYKKIMASKFAEKEKEWEKKEYNYKNALKKAEEHTKDLDNQIWDQNDRFLRIQQCSEDGRFSDIHMNNISSPNTLRKARSATQLNLMGMKNGNRISDFDRRASTRSLIPTNSNRGHTFTDPNAVRLSAMSLTTFDCRNSDFLFVAPSSATDNDRRSSNISEDFYPQLKKKGPTSGKRFSFSSAKVFPLPAEDEEQEIFDNACLSDLKQGKCVPDVELDENRISILQSRNSLLPPHLKSSYPAETQTLPPQEYKENEIKMGHLEISTSSESDSLINDKNKKSRSQTSYKRPGPPTPSKHGGRTAQALTPSNNILKESNENTASGSVRRRSFTPKFINNFFATRGQINVRQAQQQAGDENAILTPKSNRLSSIRRRFNRNSQLPQAENNPTARKFY